MILSDLEFKQMELITSTPTTSSSTGERFYQARNNEDERWALIYHTEGTPSNSSTTTIMSAHEAERYFEWEIKNVPTFATMAKWIEHNK